MNRAIGVLGLVCHGYPWVELGRLGIGLGSGNGTGVGA